MSAILTLTKIQLFLCNVGFQWESTLLGQVFLRLSHNEDSKKIGAIVIMHFNIVSNRSTFLFLIFIPY